MNITPMDMQVVIPKVTEVGKGQQNRDHQSVFQQQHGAAQLQQQSDRKLQQVQNTEKSEGKKIKEEEKRKNQQNQQNQQESAEENAEKSESVRMAVDTFRGRNIDIKM